ncbi:unnamed protein product, partial [Prorocentrum cordatum]
AQGVGAGQALLYEAWASCLERAHRHAEAGEVYRRGLAGKAEPQARLRTRLAEFERRARRHSAPVQQGNITFEAWWAAVGKCKGIALWKGKIETLSGGSHAVNGLTIETVGQAVFRHVDSDGEWSPISMVLTVLWCVLQLWCFILYVRTESEAIATSARVFAEQWLPWIVPYGMARLLGSFVPAAATGSQNSEIPMSSQNALEVTFGESTLSNQTAPETQFGVAGPAVLMLSVFVRKLQARGA